jgi:hypothetical protein
MKSTDKHLPAVVLAIIASLVALPAGAGERMKAAEIDKAFRGMTLDGVYSNGSFFTEVYNPDGSIRYHDATAADSGAWSVKNDMFCTFYEGKQGACFFVEREGANCFSFYEEDAASGGGGQARKQWTSRGWNRAEKSTCAEPVGATI